MARVESLERAITALQAGTLSEDLRLAAERDAHKLAGTVGSFGFGEGSRLAGEIESMLRTGVSAEPSYATRLSDLVRHLRRELERGDSSKPGAQAP